MQAWPSRNHGGSYRGVSFFDFMRNVMAHIHMVHVQVEKLGATQLYTDKIVRCIIRGVKNQMLWNIAEGTKQPKKVNNKMNLHNQGTKHAHAYLLLMVRMKTKRTSNLTNFYLIGSAAEVV